MVRRHGRAVLASTTRDPSMSFHLRQSLCLLGLTAMLTSPAAAQQAPRKPLPTALSKEARGAYETGQKLVKLGENAAALPHFQKAHALSQDPRILPWIARAEKALGKPARAHHAIDAYLRDTASWPQDAEKKEAEKLRGELRASLAWLRISSTEEGVLVHIDGDVAGRTPMSPLLVERGVRSVRATKEQFRPFERRDVVVGEGETSLEILLEKEPIPLETALSGAALEAYRAGRLLFQDGDHASALVKFRAAHELSKDARLLWNMAVCQKNLRRYGQVLALVERYLAEGAAVTTSQDRQEAEELLKIVRAFVTPVKIEASEAGASVQIDDEEIGRTPLEKPVLVDVGTRKIRVTKPGFSDFSVQAAISGSEQVTIQAELVAIKREGRLVVTAGPQDVISVDGQLVGQGHWEGTLTSGTHAILVTRKGKRPHQADVAIEDNETRRVQITLEAEPTRSSTWLWAGGGVLAAAGLGLGAYFLLRPETTPAPAPLPGTMPPGSVQLPLRSYHRGSIQRQGAFLQPSFAWGFR